MISFSWREKVWRPTRYIIGRRVFSASRQSVAHGTHNDQEKTYKETKSELSTKLSQHSIRTLWLSCKNCSYQRKLLLYPVVVHTAQCSTQQLICRLKCLPFVYFAVANLWYSDRGVNINAKRQPLTVKLWMIYWRRHRTGFNLKALFHV